ncbi:hypothetical protein [Dactylosporangium sp. NPDC000521]|uniref:hypothetical protein n=1 Tax=Dactylosporangium sp. NPDC000521 TaxID=3363975 RepID=UPI003698D9D2
MTQVRRLVRLASVVFAACAMLLAACDGSKSPDTASPSSPEVPGLPEGAVNSIAWTADDWIYFSYTVPSTSSGLWRQRRDGAAVPEQVDFKLPPESCGSAVINSLQPLPDGRLAIAARCDIADGFRSFAAILDVASLDARVLVQFPSFSGSGIAVLPDLNGAFVTAEAGGLCQGLALFGAQGGFRPFKHEVSIGSTTFWPDGVFRDAQEQPACGTTGDAGWPALSRDGKMLYFVARTAPPERDNRMTRADAAVVEVPTDFASPPRIVVSGIRSPQNAVTLTAHGQTFVCVLGIVDGKSGVWAFRADDGELVKSWVGPYRELSASPDGSRLLTVKKIGKNLETEILDLG